MKTWWSNNRFKAYLKLHLHHSATIYPHETIHDGWIYGYALFFEVVLSWEPFREGKTNLKTIKSSVQIHDLFCSLNWCYVIPQCKRRHVIAISVVVMCGLWAFICFMEGNKNIREGAASGQKTMIGSQTLNKQLTSWLMYRWRDWCYTYDITSGV